MFLPFYKPSPAPRGLFAGQPLPRQTANFVSRFFFHWLSPLLKVGYSRPLDLGDLWELTADLTCEGEADALERSWMARLPPSKRPERFRPDLKTVPTEKAQSKSSALQSTVSCESAHRASSGKLLEIANDKEALRDGHEVQAQGLSVTTSRDPEALDMSHPPIPADLEPTPTEEAAVIAKGTDAVEGSQTYDMALWKAIAWTAWPEWVIAVLFNYIGNILRLTSPLVTQKIIEQLTVAHTYHLSTASGSSAPTTKPRSVGYGIGLAVGLFSMMFLASMSLYHGQQRAALLGCKLRAAMVDLVSRKSMRLSGKARLEMTNGRINTMISSDCSYLDWVAPATIDFPVFPVMIIVGIALLVNILGYSALVGLGVLVVSAPAQGWIFAKILRFRQAQERLVDGRVRLLTEVIHNIRAVKLYAYEKHFGEKVSAIRQEEHTKLRNYGILRSATMGLFYFIPVLAAVLTFITYSLTGHSLTPSKVFASLQLFNVLRFPIQLLPMHLSALVDALAGIGRIADMFKSEELREKIEIDETATMAILVRGDFQFDSVTSSDNGSAKQQNENDEVGKDLSSGSEEVPSSTIESDDPVPFSLRDINLSIPRGSLVCIVGRVGTGKTALLLGLINEMRQIQGDVVFGGSVSYVPQQAWVQSGTIRDNITFSKPCRPDLERVREVSYACGLLQDFELWPEGDLTMVGEKGITLSGGQRQRICIARAAYEESEVVLLDDPLSAVDAHVGHHLLEECFLHGPLSRRTRILVTHHLDVLPKADIILVLDRNDHNEGRIVQKGTYRDLLEREGLFRKLIEEYGSTNDPSNTAPGTYEAEHQVEHAEAEPNVVSPGTLVLEEERTTGGVPWAVYHKYFNAIGSWWWTVAFFSCLLLTQAAQVGNSLFLGYWSGSTIEGFETGQYMAVYAGLGGAIAILGWASIYSMILAGIRASYTMFNGAWHHVMRAPTTWHDRTPTGRIISRLSKDIEMLDDRLAQFWNQFLTSSLAFIGTLALVVYTYPLLGLFFIPLLTFYYIAAIYYRQTSREVKRLDSLLRSHVYSSFAEQLAGLPVIRAFNQQCNFQKRLQAAVNDQNRAYVLSIVCQRWLSTRLEAGSQLLVLLIAIFGTIFRDSVSPARFGVVLTYTLASTSTLTSVVSLFAVCEQEMNNVERLQHYNELEMEPDTIRPSDPPVVQWPTRGEIEFTDVELRYRPDLPLVLRGLSFRIKAGEKVGIIGRTGAGKSSIAQALFRTVDICKGKIAVDGVDLRLLGLYTLRQRLAAIPQDAFLFAGTVRDNIDPTGVCGEAELNAALKLIRENAGASHSLREKFKLDVLVSAEGCNFSAGEKQLLSLIRALIRGCKVILLDEATSSVDPETDALIQRIIQAEFSGVTLISIAHRLQTVAYYDRILVLDAGKIAEFDTPFGLFDTPGSVFRKMCEKKNLSRADLLRIQADAASPAGLS